MVAHNTLYVYVRMHQSNRILPPIHSATHRLATPRLQRFLVSGQVRVDDLWNDVFPQLPLERLKRERGVQQLHPALHLRVLRLFEPSTDRVRHRAHAAHDRVLRLVVGLPQRHERAQDGVRLLHLFPALVLARVLVENHRGAGSVGVSVHEVSGDGGDALGIGPDSAGDALHACLG